MALLHRAELRPSKLELITPWLAEQSWAYSADAGWERIAAYRFDDPDGEVGVETMIVGSGGGAELQVPVTYRGAQLNGADEWLIGTMEHSVLGRRWVYDAAGDPVYAQTLSFAITSGASEAEQYVEENGERVVQPGTAWVKGSGAGAEMPAVASISSQTVDRMTMIVTESFTLFVPRVVGELLPAASETLTGGWGESNAS